MSKTSNLYSRRHGAERSLQAIEIPLRPSELLQQQVAAHQQHGNYKQATDAIGEAYDRATADTEAPILATLNNILTQWLKKAQGDQINQQFAPALEAANEIYLTAAQYGQQEHYQLPIHTMLSEIIPKHYEEADRLTTHRSFGKAVEAYDRISDAYEILGHDNLAQESQDKAENVLSQWRAIAGSYAQKKEFLNAVREYQAIIPYESDEPHSEIQVNNTLLLWHEHADAQLDQKQFRHAIRDYTSLSSIYRELRQDHMATATELQADLARTNWQRHADELSAAQSYDKARVEYSGLAVAYARSCQFARALEAQNNAGIKATEAEIPSLQNALSITFTNWQKYASDLMKNGNFNGAYIEYEAILERFPDNEAAQKNMSIVLQQLPPKPVAPTWQERISPRAAAAPSSPRIHDPDYYRNATSRPDGGSQSCAAM